MKWNSKELKYLYSIIEECRDDKDKETEREAKDGNYNFASVSHNESYAFTTCLNWIVKIDNELPELKRLKVIN